MMTLDPINQFFQEDDSHSRDDDLKNTKDNQLYKDTMALLKRKMCTAQDLLEQFNHKVKEYNDLNLELHELKIDKEKLFNKYNAASEKLTRLELSIRDYEKSRDEHKYTADKQKVELDEKKKHIEQLEYKIREMEKDSVHLKDEIKKLQQENKISKSIAKKSTKASQTNRTSQHDVSVNTDFKKVLPRKAQMRDKNTITDNDTMPYSAYCLQCEKQSEFPPLQQILKIMSSPPPPSLTNQFSPPCSPRSVPSSSQQSESIVSNTFDQYYHENSYTRRLDKKAIEKSKKIHEEPDRPSFMLIDQLNRRINNLERQIKKKKWKQKQGNDCHRQCCPSKNIKFIVQLPNGEKCLEYAKPSQHKQIHVKRLNKKHTKSKNDKQSKVREWQVENDIEIQNIQLNLQHSSDQLEKKSENLKDNNEIDCSGSPAVHVPNVISKHQVHVDSCVSKTMQPPHTESLSTLDINADAVIVNSTNKDKVCDDENENECHMQSSVSNPVLTDPINEKMNCISEKVLQTIDSEHNLSLDVLTKVNSDDIFDTISESSHNSNLIPIEYDNHETVVDKNEDTVFTNIEKNEIIDEALALERKLKLKSLDDFDKIESTLPNIRKIRTFSTSSSEYDELFSTSTICITDRNLNLNVKRRECKSFFQVIESPGTDSDKIENSDEKQIDVQEEVLENKRKNEHSSDDSLNLKHRVACRTLKKRGKCNNIIESDNSSEEAPRPVINSKYRKSLIATKKRIISKINKLKKTSNCPINSKPVIKPTESQSDLRDTYIPTKKQRIAHVPKDNSEAKEVVCAEQILQKLRDTVEIEQVKSENALTKPKYVNKRVKKKMEDTIDTLRKPKKLKLAKSAQSQQNKDKQSATFKNEKLEPISANTKLELIAKNENHQLITETDFKRNENFESNHQKKEPDATNELSELDMRISQTVTEKMKGTDNCANIKSSDNNKGENIRNEQSLDELKKDSPEVSEDEEIIPARNLRGRKVTPKIQDRRISRRLQESDSLVANNDVGTNNCLTGSLLTPSTSKQTQKKKRKIPTKNQLKLPFDGTNSSLGNTSIVSYFNDFLLGVHQDSKQENFEHLKKHEGPIRDQLSVLIETEPLTTDVLLQVVENLLNITPLEVVAVVLVEYASTEYLDDVKYNTTYTPPAPPMTKFEQKCVTLITTINEKQPEFMDDVGKGLEYKLFRLGKPLEIHTVERLFRILVVLNKIKKDREKVRMLFCDALYCYNTRAMNIIYIALTCWSEVFPKHDANNDILVKTIVHIIMSANVNRPFSKLMPLKRLLTDYYGYPNCGFRVENFKQELMDNLKENVFGVNTSIILLCKSKGPDWALEYIVKDLKKMIVHQVHPSMYDGLTLLGDIVRPFSSENFKSTLKEITDQLCEVLSGNPGSHDLEEGIVSCLLNIGGKFSFDREKIAKCVFKWQSNKELRQTTKEKFRSFLKTHNVEWWRKFVQQNFPVAEQNNCH
ncbi:uncharacterized protein LOC131666146 [Phymastichus coffea]|uniref:uncharacterized protein LOC131666146 n=1 Tax=Phymastichus coffea TaxID=108790 RepID=UPI00273AF518|nr:uncharacterized protein LOC131666146 [Phymastichus coffea]